ncbi:MAG: hypothetical protein K2J12_05855 [Muribaculaceae bacterium]|nr:hypothetical protein [Muribaculaceae bacterium]
MSAITDFYLKAKAISTISAASVMAFVGPVVPYGAICTAMIVADLLSARMLARRVRRRTAAGATCEALKFSSRRLGATVVTLVKTYALLLLAHGVDVVIIADAAPLSLLRFCAALICFWQLWSILENESSANNSTWARIAQRILIDKTERHLGIDLRELHQSNTSNDNKI